MLFDDFLKYLPKIEKEKLLSTAAHQKMAPLERILSIQSVDINKSNPKKAAVMMLFYPKNNETFLVLIERNSYKGVHSAQIAFPGGKFETTDASLLHTALREMHEEIGIEPHCVNFIKSFSEIFIPPSNFLVFPFMGVIHFDPIFIPDEKEVSSIVEIPLRIFLSDDTVSSINMDTSYAKNIEVPIYSFMNHHIWGATAMMMSELKEVLKSALSA